MNKEYFQLYYQKNKERMNESNRKYYQKNKKKILQKQKESRLKSPEKYRKLGQKSYQKRKIKLNESRREKYHRNHLGAKDKRKHRRWENIKIWIQILTEHLGEIKCLKCGYNENFSAIDFHHRNPEEKKYKICDLLNLKPSAKRTEIMKLEIGKCDLLCANCHMNLHHPEFLLELLGGQFC